MLIRTLRAQALRVTPATSESRVTPVIPSESRVAPKRAFEAGLRRARSGLGQRRVHKIVGIGVRPTGFVQHLAIGE
jgi:hypothetical protein